jgi:hypothetical protein
MSNLPYTFFGGKDRHTLFVSVEVSSPDGNFDTLGKIFFTTAMNYRIKIFILKLQRPGFTFFSRWLS